MRNTNVKEVMSSKREPRLTPFTNSALNRSLAVSVEKKTEEHQSESAVKNGKMSGRNNHMPSIITSCLTRREGQRLQVDQSRASQDRPQQPLQEQQQGHLETAKR